MAFAHLLNQVLLLQAVQLTDSGKDSIPVPRNGLKLKTYLTLQLIPELNHFGWEVPRLVTCKVAIAAKVCIGVLNLVPEIRIILRFKQVRSQLGMAWNISHSDNIPIPIFLQGFKDIFYYCLGIQGSIHKKIEIVPPPGKL